MRVILARRVALGVIAVILVFLYFPIAIIALMSFNSSGFATFPIEGLTVRWYTDLISDERFVSAGILSLQVAAISSFLGVVFGTMAAFGTSSAFNTPRSTRLGLPLEALYLMPVLVPALVLAISMAVGFRAVGISLSFWTLVAGHTVTNAPIVYLLVRSRLRGFDWSVVEAARLLGAGPFAAFRRITAPLVSSAVIGGAILSFAISLDNFVMSLILTGGDSTLPLLVWSMMRQGFSPSVNAISSLLVVGTLGLALIAQRFIRGPRGLEGS